MGRPHSDDDSARCCAGEVSQAPPRRLLPECSTLLTSTPSSRMRIALWPTVTLVRRLPAVGCLIRLVTSWVESSVGHPVLAVAAQRASRVTTSSDLGMQICMGLQIYK